MPKEFSRTQRIGELIQRELSALIHRELTNPALGMITICEVDTSPDLKSAKVYITSLASSMTHKELERTLNEHAGELRYLLAQRMTTRTTPRLHFIYDETLDKAIHINELLNSVKPSESDDNQ